MPTFLVGDAISFSDGSAAFPRVLTTNNAAAGDFALLSDSVSIHPASSLAQRGNIDYDQIRRSARAGDGDKLHTLAIAGSQVTGNTVKFDSAGNLIDAGVAPGGAGTPGADGSFILLETHTASSSSSLDFTTCISSTYDDYVIEIVNLIPATDNVNLQVIFSINGGSSYDTSAIYDYASSYFFLTGDGHGGVANASAIAIAEGQSNTSTYGVVGNFRFYSPGSTSLYKRLEGQMHGYQSGSGLVGKMYAGWYRSTSAVNAFRIAASSGNIASGIVRVYGVSKTVSSGGGGGGGSGTVTSVGMTVPGEFSVTGSPITTSGTLAVAKANQNANLVWAGPSSGAAASPTFRALTVSDLPSVAPGALILLEQHTASSSSSLDFTTCITSAYDEYQIEFINILPATNATNIMMRCSTNGGSSYDSSSIYDFEESYFFSSNAGGGAINSNQTAFQLLGSISNSATVPSSGNWRFFPSSTTAYKMLYGNRSTYNTAVASNLLGGLTVAYYKSTTAVNAFQFYSSSGNIASGTVRVYGMAKTTVASPDFILVNGV